MAKRKSKKKNAAAERAKARAAAQSQGGGSSTLKIPASVEFYTIKKGKQHNGTKTSILLYGNSFRSMGC